jgi:hypothetical protein
MKENLDIDLEVAKALNLKQAHIQDGCVQFVLGIMDQWRSFAPSTDLADAFWAANRINLFDHSQGAPQLGIHPGNPYGNKVEGAPIWAVAHFDDWDRLHGCDPIATGETPQLAICNAVLELAEVPA